MNEHSDEDTLLFRFLTEIGIIEQLSSARLEKVLPDGLKVSQFIVLNHLTRLDWGWGPARLASALQVTKGAITNTLNRLEARGLIEIAPDPEDGRGKRVSLTEAGRDMREHCIRLINPALADMEATLGRERFEEALPFLEDTRRYLDTHRD